MVTETREQICALLNAKKDFHLYNYSNCGGVEYINVSFTFGFIYFSKTDIEILEFDEEDYKEIFNDLENWDTIAIELN